MGVPTDAKRPAVLLSGYSRHDCFAYGSAPAHDYWMPTLTACREVYDRVGLESEGDGVGFHESPAVDAARPPGQVVCLQPLQQRYGHFGLAGDMLERDVAPLPFAAQPEANTKFVHWMALVPLSQGFYFKNYHNVQPG